MHLSAGSGVLTTFTMDEGQVASAFGSLLTTSVVKVNTWSRPRRSFERTYKTGSAELALLSAEGKFSKSTSTVTIKFSVKCPGGGGWGWGGSYDDY